MVPAAEWPAHSEIVSLGLNGVDFCQENVSGAQNHLHKLGVGTVQSSNINIIDSVL